MADVPETRYAWEGDFHIAYQVLGDGPDLLFVPNGTFPIDVLWDEPAVAGPLRRLASFSRLILTDILGAGSSAYVPPAGNPPLQYWSDGLLAVLDAVGSESASILAMQGMTLPVMLMAASHPERVRSLALWSPFARFLRADDHQFGAPESLLTKYVDHFGDVIGTGALIDVLAPSWAGDTSKRRWWARCERLSGGPGLTTALELWMRLDVRHAVDGIQAPTLLMRRRGDRDMPREHVLDLAKRIPHARLVEFDGDDGIWFAGDSDSVLDEIESFVTGERRRHSVEPGVIDGVVHRHRRVDPARGAGR